MPLLARALLHSSHRCLPGKKSPLVGSQHRWDAELEKILKSIFHLPGAQSHEVLCVGALPGQALSVQEKYLYVSCPVVTLVTEHLQRQVSIALQPGTPLALGYVHVHLLQMHLTT